MMSYSIYVNMFYIFGKIYFVFSFHTCHWNLTCSSSYSLFALKICFIIWTLNQIYLNVGSWVLDLSSWYSDPGFQLKSPASRIMSPGPGSFIPVKEYSNKSRQIFVVVVVVVVVLLLLVLVLVLVVVATAKCHVRNLNLISYLTIQKCQPLTKLHLIVAIIYVTKIFIRQITILRKKMVARTLCKMSIITRDRVLIFVWLDHGILRGSEVWKSL